MSNTTTWKEYINKFDELLTQENPEPPYDEEMFLEFVKLNKSRLKRWIKTTEINEELTQLIKGIDETQTWYLITEPWCGDAAHSTPFIYLMSELNPKIDLKVVYRDTPPLMIEDYLTDGGKAIPKLVIRDKNENDLHVWGPRPAECQKLFHQLKAEDADFEKLNNELQAWYNKDKGKSIQSEFAAMLNS